MPGFNTQPFPPTAPLPAPAPAPLTFILRADFSLLVHRLKLLGFNALRLPVDFAKLQLDVPPPQGGSNTEFFACVVRACAFPCACACACGRDAVIHAAVRGGRLLTCKLGACNAWCTGQLRGAMNATRPAPRCLTYSHTFSNQLLSPPPSPHAQLDPLEYIANKTLDPLLPKSVRRPPVPKYTGMPHPPPNDTGSAACGLPWSVPRAANYTAVPHYGSTFNFTMCNWYLPQGEGVQSLHRWVRLRFGVGAFQGRWLCECGWVVVAACS